MGAINAACTHLPPILLTTRAETSPPVFDAREALRQERESSTVQDAMDYIKDGTAAFSSAFIGVGAGIEAMGTFKPRLFKPKWSAEIDPMQQRMWHALSQTMCLGNFFELDPAELPWIFLLIITLPYADFSTAGKQRGGHGETGWMYVEVIRRVLGMTELPTMIEIETADGILNTNGGAELREARQLLAGWLAGNRLFIQKRRRG